MAQAQAPDQDREPQTGLKLNGRLNEKDKSYDFVMSKNVLARAEIAQKLSNVVRMSEQMLQTEFNWIHQMPLKKSLPSHEMFDIYCNIHPFCETAISLAGTTPDERYINASRIVSVFGEDSEQNLMVAAQGPMDTTLGAFWRMVHQERVGMIVTLVHSIPGDCALYFPEERGLLTYDQMQVELREQEPVGCFATHRLFQVTNLESQTSRQVNHYHFHGWEDYAVPYGASLEEFSSIMHTAADFVTANASKNASERERLLVHCRAGVGRTGTTLAIINATIAIKQQLASGITDPSLSIFSIVRRLREQRMWMVQTFDQYCFIYDFVCATKWQQNRQ